MGSPKLWRWLALMSVLVNVAFNYIYASDGTMTTVTDTYRTVFRPAGYAFSIWGVIYLSWIVFCIHELIPAQLKNPSLEALSKPVILSSLLSICWLITYTNFMIGASLALIIAMLIVAIIQLRNAHRLISDATVNKWLVLVPFALYAAWLSVATIANSFIWVRYMNWAGPKETEEVWGIALVVAAGLIGAIVALQYRNPFFPLVIAWASVALWSEQGQEFVSFGYVAVAVAVLMCLLSIFNFSRRWPERKMVL